MSKIDLLLSKLKDNNTTNEKKINVECATDKSLEKKKKMTSLINIFIDNTGTFVKLDDLHKLSTSVNYKKKIEK
jgi:glyceraldehyde-3-phosphate dehydrogenase/erythrose-4-phosphate dehydrogenase